MTGALLESPRVAPFASAPGRAAARPLGGGRPTLEDLLESALQAARTPAGATCPVCSGAMHATNGTARCGDCGSTLS